LQSRADSGLLELLFPRAEEIVSMMRDRVAWLKGGAAACKDEPPKAQHPWRLVLLGAPGVGKGTQAELMSERLGPCQLSTGEIFRAAKCQSNGDLSPTMSAALEYMRRGELVPDQTVLDIVRERARCLHCGGGFLLDGFPRTVAQAQALQATLQQLGVKLDAVLSYELSTEEIVQRISGRRTCPQCRATYHVTGLPPKQAGICDACGTTLTQREDDRPESVRVRLAAYERSTKPLEEFYRGIGLLVSIQVGAVPEVTYERTMTALESRL
jgi:adenylate kinase